MSPRKIHSAIARVLLVTALLSLSGLAETFDYHGVRGREVKSAGAGIIEGEHLPMHGKARAQDLKHYGDAWSGGAHLLWNGRPGESMETAFRVGVAGRYRVMLQLTQAPDYGIVAVLLNGAALADNVDLYAPGVRLAGLLDLGELALEEGEQQLALHLKGSNAKAGKFQEGYLLGIDYVKLERLDVPADGARKKVPAPEAEALTAPVVFADVRSVMAEHCFRCHGADKIKGKVNLEALRTREAFLDDIVLAGKVADALAFREMPPEDEKQLPAGAHALLNTWIQGILDEHLESSSALAPVVMRRMNRYEYSNAVSQLLQLKGDIYPLPEKVLRAAIPYFDPASGRFPDSVSVSNRALGKNQIEQHILTGVVPFAIDLQAEHGFNNRGDELSFPPILLESFLKLGRSVVNSPEFDGYSALTPTLFAPPVPEPSLEEAVAIAQARLKPLLERAFRRPVEEATAERYRVFFRNELRRSGEFSSSMKHTVAAILASPRFLFITERNSGGDADLPLSPFELATRLSFFLWSTIPDKALLASARSGGLRQAEVLDAEVGRMLEDPRSRALAENFARQWLRLDQLITAVPDFERFEHYYSRIGCEQWKFGLQTMIEPLLLFESIMVEDRSIMLLVDSNYSYRSDEVASWYADKVPFGNKKNRGRFNTNAQVFKRRALNTRREGGVITTAATLTMTSSPLRTSPINRGAWVATVIFNKPPPPPPDVVPEIEADDAEIEAKGLTLRQRLIQHQVNQSCVSCHQKIDPLGFALENFDAVGRWRDTYRSGLPIDASGTLFGEEKFQDIVGLKDSLLNNPEWFMRGFSEHLLSYALGRELELSDRPAVNKIVRRVLTDHGQFSTVVLEIVKSYPFLHKTSR